MKPFRCVHNKRKANFFAGWDHAQRCSARSTRNTWTRAKWATSTTGSTMALFRQLIGNEVSAAEPSCERWRTNDPGVRLPAVVSPGREPVKTLVRRNISMRPEKVGHQCPLVDVLLRDARQHYFEMELRHEASCALTSQKPVSVEIVPASPASASFRERANICGSCFLTLLSRVNRNDPNLRK